MRATNWRDSFPLNISLKLDKIIISLVRSLSYVLISMLRAPHGFSPGHPHREVHNTCHIWVTGAVGHYYNSIIKYDYLIRFHTHRDTHFGKIRGVSWFMENDKIIKVKLGVECVSVLADPVYDGPLFAVISVWATQLIYFDRQQLESHKSILYYNKLTYV